MRIGFIDIAEKSGLYIFEKRSGNLEHKDTIPISCTSDYDISIPEIQAGIDEFYLSLPVSALSFRILELPFADKEKILSVLPFELENIILKGAQGVVIDGIILGSNNGKNMVLAVYEEKAFISKIIGRLKTFNIDPRVITSIELRRLVKEFNPEKLLNPVDIKPEERIGVAVEEIKNSLINLRRGELSYTGDTEKVKSSLRLTAALGITVLILLALMFALKIFSVRKEISSMQAELNKVYSGIFPGDNNTIPSLYQFKSKIKELKGQEESMFGISPLKLLLDLSDVERGSAAFSEIAADKGRITLRGDAAALGDLQKIKDELGKILNEVNISDSKTSAQGRVIFTITAKEKRA